MEIYPKDLEPQFSDEIVQFFALFKQFNNETTSTENKSCVSESRELQMFTFISTRGFVAAFQMFQLQYACIFV